MQSIEFLERRHGKSYKCRCLVSQSTSKARKNRSHPTCFSEPKRNHGDEVRFRHAIALILGLWLRGQSTVRATLVGGDAGFRIRRRPDTIVGIDVALANGDTPLYRLKGEIIFDGPPLLAIEITSMSDKQQDVDGKVEEYLRAKVPLVWIVNPTMKTIAVYRPDAEPQLFTLSSEMTAEPHLPGLRFKVADVFAKMPAVQDEAPQG